MPKAGMMSEPGTTSARHGSVRTSLRARFWVEAACGAATGALAVVTLLWKDWIEAIFGAAPDQGNGSLEWLVVTLLAVATVALAAAARGEWRQARRRLGLSEG